MSKDIKVLVVEDSEDDARLTLLALKRGGFRTSHLRVQDAPALRAALSGERWDAVLADFSLPRFSGVEALNIFRGTELDIPFIFVSGTIGEETAVAAMKAGASDYVMKHNLARLAPVLERELEQALIRAQHRQAQLDLKRSHDRYMDLYDFAPVGYMTLAQDGVIVQLNLTCAALLGERREQLRGLSFGAFVAAADSGRWAEHFERTLRSSERQRLELELRGRGGVFHAQLDCMRVLHAQGLPMMRAVLIDISERRAAEAELRKFELQLRHVQKMESIGTLAGGIAHDFNNILGAILGNVDLARVELDEDHAVQAKLGEIRKAGLRAGNLVRQILTFSRREPQQLRIQQLRPMIEETHKLLRATVPAGVEIELLLSDAPLYVHADATQMQQVLMNLCTNAWHALQGDAGRIVIGLEPQSLDSAAARRLGGLSGGAYTRLWVSDTGMGIDAATRERIFEPFFTTKPVGQGTGLGLAVAHGILTAHHGAIQVDSEPGRGSTFHLYLPCVAAPADQGPAMAAAPAPIRGHGEHVLYVDDDETMILMVEQLLLRSGYRVSAFQDALQAIAAVREHPENFDFVVTDFNMPDCSGLDFAQEMARIRPDMPVVISSGYITDALRLDASRTGVRGLLEKQNTSQDLGDLVGQILAAEARRGR